MELQIPCGVCNGIFNYTSLCEFHQGKLLLHLTIPFEEKPKTNLPGNNLRYYRQRKQMTTRLLAEKLDIVPSTVAMYENGKHPIPYDVAVKLTDVLEVEASLLYDDFSRFLTVPYAEALKNVRTALGLSQKAFAEQMEIVPSYYYKLEEGNRRPSRKVYQKIYAALEATSRQTSLLWEHPLQ
ncbi:helix-turn-helix transcriptional regulator [Frisingicoccus sp.]|uniref:helix-turn-helix transcriptional regulator n=1 Tax=Frisingicoccus sp. TaxID=1918627 RepID=UPI002E775EC7|nr:helix-turn-helix transcriptional regulator [Frisingicoccus sp.]MEE0751249.1 helix-turn-helix transcriptional regulator [Frisingicoccus sp.]